MYKTGSWGAQAKERYVNRVNSKYWYEYNLKRRLEILEKYGSKCGRCGFDDYRVLQIDHVNGGGKNEHGMIAKTIYYKKVLNDKSGNYQILCANCNWIKKYEENETSSKKGVNITD